MVQWYIVAYIILISSTCVKYLSTFYRWWDNSKNVSVAYIGVDCWGGLGGLDPPESEIPYPNPSQTRCLFERFSDLPHAFFGKELCQIFGTAQCPRWIQWYSPVRSTKKIENFKYNWNSIFQYILLCHFYADSKTVLIFSLASIFSSQNASVL